MRVSKQAKKKKAKQARRIKYISRTHKRKTPPKRSLTQTFVRRAIVCSHSQLISYQIFKIKSRIPPRPYFFYVEFSLFFVLRIYHYDFLNFHYGGFALAVSKISGGKRNISLNIIRIIFYPCLKNRDYFPVLIGRRVSRNYPVINKVRALNRRQKLIGNFIVFGVNRRHGVNDSALIGTRFQFKSFLG